MLPEWLHRALRLPYLLKTTSRGKGPTVVLLHGLASNQRVWKKVVEELEQHHRCVTLDLLGHGDSPKPTHLRYTVEDHLRSIRWTLFWHGVWRPFTLVGFSMGSIIGTHFAAAYPRRLKQLIVLALPIYRKRDSVKNLKRFEGMLDAGYLAYYTALRHAPKRWSVNSASRLKRAFSLDDEQMRLDDETWYPVVSSLQNTIESQSVLTDISRLPAALPVTVAYGSLDILVISSNLKYAFQDRPNTEFVRVLSGHEVSRRFGRAVIEAVRRSS